MEPLTQEIRPSSPQGYSLAGLHDGSVWLTALAKKLRETGETQETSVRQILQSFGHKKRGRWVLNGLRHALADVGLIVVPEMDAVALDDTVVICLDERRQQARSLEPVVDPEGVDGESESTHDSRTDGLRIGALPTARKGVVWVRPDDSVSSALAKMVLNDYSQLPVMRNDRQPVGVFGWRSLGRAVVSRDKVSRDAPVIEFMFEQYLVCRATDSLLDALPRIVEHEFVLVQDEHRRIAGIVTTTDLANVLQDKFKGFAILAEIEGIIREILEAKFSHEDLCSAKDPTDQHRSIESVDDLTFGEYRRLLEKPELWDKLGVRLERQVFLEKMERVNRIRNDVMHFAVDEIGEEELKELWQFLLGLRFLNNQG